MCTCTCYTLSLHDSRFTINFRVHGVCACENADYFYDHTESEMTELGLTQTPSGGVLKARDIVDLIDGYVGVGYTLSTEEELGLQ